MTTAWDAWPSTSPILLPVSRSPTKGSSSFSPNSFDRSWLLSARMTRQESNPAPPILPPEIIRRIIRSALVLDPSFPSPFRRESYDPAWDEFAGRAARRALMRRVGDREGVMRSARAFMAVCRSWKQLVLSYLYAEPNITGDNVAFLAHAVVAGDRRWSDINLHPHSTPGRWITVLDLSNLGPGGNYLGADAVTVSKACAVLLDLTPSVVHLRLPAHGVRLDDLRLAPCIRKLQALEGVHLAHARDEEDAVRLLRATKALKVLGLVWVGSVVEVEEMEVRKTLNMPYLHTLTLVAGRPGPLLASLTRAELPALTRLVTSPYESELIAFEDDPERGGVRALQVAHGAQLASLTYLSTPDWPRRDLLPSEDTLSLHPNLAHLHLGLPNTLLNEHPELGSALCKPHHPLSVVTLPRWPRVVAGADVSVPASNGPPSPAGNCFLSALCASPSNLKIVAVDGFTWVPPALGRFAAESGDSGMMRQWASWLSRRGVELRDMDGAPAPVICNGRASFSSAGRRSVDGGRRSLGGDSGWPR